MSDSLHIVCTGCLAVNRVPAQRLRQTPKCGRCHEPLFKGRPTTLTQASFHKVVKHSDIPVVVDFWAPWCAPCRVMAPAFEQAAGDLGPDACLAKVDTEAEPRLGQEFGIRSIPTLVLFRHSREIVRHSGAIGAGDIVRWVRSAT
jgi:thioredoxin 2